MAWHSIDEDGSNYLAIFNTGVKPTKIETSLSKMNLSGSFQARDLWNKCDLGIVSESVVVEVSPHGASLLRLSLV